MPAFVKVAGAWKTILPTRVRAGTAPGTWRDVGNAWVKVAGVWRQYVTAAAAVVTFDPTKKHTNIDLQNSNMAITNQQIQWGVCGWAYLNEARTSGKLYYEFQMNALGGPAGGKASVGVGDGTYLLGNIMTTGTTFHGNTGIYKDNVLQKTHGTEWGIGDVIQMAIDYGGGRVWFGRNNVWSGTVDVTGSIVMTTTPKIVGAAVFINNDAPAVRLLTAKLKASVLTYGPPSGYTAAGGA